MMDATFSAIGGPASTSRRDFPQAIQAFLAEPAAPQDNGIAIDVQFPRDGAVALLRGGGQHDAAAQADLLRRSESGYPLTQLLLLASVKVKAGAIAARIQNNRSGIKLFIYWLERTLDLRI
jgi:hypothetical protein